MFSTVSRSTVAGAVAALLSISAVAAPGTPATQVAPAGPQNDVVFYSATGVGCAPDAGQFNTRVAPMEPRAEAVKNAPYSAVGTNEVVQTLSDGNRIVRNNTMKYYRDGAGRTRTEYSLSAIGPFTPDSTQSIVTIIDPVAGERYVLNSSAKRADVLKLSGGGGGPGQPHTGFFFKSIQAGPDGEAGGVVVNGNMVSAGAPPVMVTSGSLDGPPGNAVFVMRAAPGGVTTAASGGAVGGCKIDVKPLPEAQSLGERTIEGLKVTGSRREFTIEAGSVGNEQPIVVSTEQWFSPDLGVVVSSSHHDPMIGDTNYKLTQISRAEPDASLFKIPADFTRQDIAPVNFKLQKFEPGAAPPQGRVERVDPAMKPAAYTGK